VAASRLAIDLSDTTIRALEGALFGPMVYAEAPLPDGALVAGRIEDPAAVGATLAELLGPLNLKETRALIASSNRLSVFRMFSFPDRSGQRQIEAMMRKELPLPPERLMVHWTDVTRGKDGQRLFAVASDRTMVTAVTDAVKASGVQPLALEPKGLCLARAVGISDCVIVDLKGAEAEAIVLEDWLPRLSHSFTVDRAAPAALVPSLAAGLKSATAYYRRQNQGADLSDERPVVIVGDVALEQAALDALSAIGGSPVENAPRPSCIDEAVPMPGFLACMGLLMRRS
jgi:hypothetical protein